MNQYTGAGGKTFAYDNNANLTNDGYTTFVYDTENRLISASGAKNAILKYDPKGRLFELTSAGTTTQFLYDGDALVAEYVNGVITNRYVHGSQVDEPNIWYSGSAVAASSRRYLHSDHQGSIITISNSSAGLYGINRYDAYGIPQATNVGRFAYTGQIQLPELGLYYYKARIYSPHLGRFLQTDPIGYEDQMNLYAYVGNDPVNKTDPSGMAQCGSNLKGEKCETALKDADQARNDAMTVSSGIKEITGKMADGEKLSDADNATVAAIGEKFGNKFTSEKGLNKLAGGLDKAANKIGARGEGAVLMQGNNKPMSNGNERIAYASPLTNKIYLNNGFFSAGSLQPFYMLHEGSHLAWAWRDSYIRKGSNHPLYNKDTPLFGAQRNADTYSCLVYGGCGF